MRALAVDTGQPGWRSDAGTDLNYRFVTPLVTKALARANIYSALLTAAFIADKGNLEGWLQSSQRAGSSGAGEVG